MEQHYETMKTVVAQLHALRGEPMTNGGDTRVRGRILAILYGKGHDKNGRCATERWLEDMITHYERELNNARTAIFDLDQ